MKAVRDDAGFTLLELLVSLSLLGLIMTYMFTSLTFGKRAWEKTEDVDRATRIETVRAFLSRRLARTMPLHGFDAATRQTRLAFLGEPDRVRFVATTPGHTEVAGLYTHDIGLTDRTRARDAGAALVVSQTLFRPGETTAAADVQTEPRLLLEDVGSLSLAYFGARRRGETPSWHDTWDGADALPRLVRLRLEFAASPGRHWPDLIVPLRLAPQ